MPRWRIDIYQPYTDPQEPGCNCSRLPIEVSANTPEEAWVKVQKLGYELTDRASAFYEITDERTKPECP